MKSRLTAAFSLLTVFALILSLSTGCALLFGGEESSSLPESFPESSDVGTSSESNSSGETSSETPSSNPEGSEPESSVPSSSPESSVPSSKPESSVPSSKPESSVPSSKPESSVPSSKPEDNNSSDTPSTNNIEGFVNVKDYGAKGNGSADDTTAIKNAVSAAAGKIVFFPEGTYKVTSLTFPDNVIPYFAKNAFVNHSGTVTVNSKEIYSSGTAVFIGNGGFAGFSNIGTLNVKWFGAYGDGKHDDTAAIQAAVNRGVSIYVPEGTYLINSSVRLDQKAISDKNTFFIGDGMKKSTFKVASGVKGFYGAASSAVAAISFDSIGIVGTDRTAYGVYFTKVFRVDMQNCYLAGLKWGCYYTYAGGCRFAHNLAENNEIVYNIGEYSMFLYYEYLTNKNNGRFIYCDVPESGGVSNGIMISHCTAEGSELEDVYVTRNQTVFIEDCEFTGGKGGKASIYYYSSCDMRVKNTVITSDPKASGRDGIMFDNVVDGYVEGTNVTAGRYAFSYKGNCRGGVYVKNNTLKGGTADVGFIGYANDIKIFRNNLNGAVPAGTNSSSQKVNILFCQNKIAANKCNIAALAGISTGVVGNNDFADGNM